MKKGIKRLLTDFISSICTLMAFKVSASACSWGYYQPEEPDCLRE